MERSPSITNIAKALQVFQQHIEKIPKDATNPFFNSSYCSLSSILEKIKQPLQESGLSFTQFPTGQNGLTTVLMHGESGEYMQSDYFMQPVKSDPQAMGSVLTYMRRYCLAAILGLNLADQKDDDGNYATHGASTPKAGNYQQKADDTSKEWLDENTTAYHEAVENLKAGRVTFKDLYDQFKISKNVRAALEAETAGAPPESATASEKPWLDKNSKKFDLVVDRLKNKQTTLSQVAQYFKLNKEVRAELQGIVNESAGIQ